MNDRTTRGTALLLLLAGMALRGVFDPALPAARATYDPVLPIPRGGTGASTAATARTALGLPALPTTGMVDVALRGPVWTGQWGYLTADAFAGGPPASLDGMGLFRAIGEVGSTASEHGRTSSGTWTKLLSTTTITNNAGWTPGGSILEGDNLPYWVIKWAPADVVDVRIFVGFTNQALSTTIGADTPASGRYVGLSFSNDGVGVASRDDTNWQWIEDDDTTRTVTDTTVAVGSADTVYWLEIDMTALASITLTLRNSSWTSLATRTVTSSPFAASSVVNPIIACSNLGAVDAKGVTTYQSSILSRVGAP